MPDHPSYYILIVISIYDTRVRLLLRSESIANTLARHILLDFEKQLNSSWYKKFKFRDVSYGEKVKYESTFVGLSIWKRHFLTHESPPGRKVLGAGKEEIIYAWKFFSNNNKFNCI